MSAEHLLTLIGLSLALLELLAIPSPSGFTNEVSRYICSRPAAMGVCGQRSVLGFNLNKLMNGLAGRRKVS